MSFDSTYEVDVSNEGCLDNHVLVAGRGGGRSRTSEGDYGMSRKKLAERGEIENAEPQAAETSFTAFSSPSLTTLAFRTADPPSHRASRAKRSFRNDEESSWHSRKPAEDDSRKKGKKKHCNSPFPFCNLRNSLSGAGISTEVQMATGYILPAFSHSSKS